MLDNIIIGIDNRVVDKDEQSKDIFIDCFEKVVEIKDDSSQFFCSRIQFPKVRMILIRISKNSSICTIHILKDIDLLSACSNFEVDLISGKLLIFEEGGNIKIKRYKGKF